MITTYDRYRNMIMPGCKVMDSETGTIGIISHIEAENGTPEKIRRLACVDLNNSKKRFKPENLMKLGNIH